MKYISICIPTYEMGGEGAKFLRFSFERLCEQTFKDFDVVVSDHSKDNAIKNACDEYSNKLDILYIKNEKKRGSSSANINNAIQNATGKIIKILFQDDFLCDKKSLEIIVDGFKDNNNIWLITGCVSSTDGYNFYRPYHPSYNDLTILEKNTIGPPSVLAIRNQNVIMFDENLLWWMDLDYYKRCFMKYGKPIIVDDICVVSRVGSHQISNSIINEDIKEKEYCYINKKYNINNYWRRVMVYKIKRFFRTVKFKMHTLSFVKINKI